MEFKEVEIMPGIYLTDFRKKEKTNEICFSPEEYRMELRQKGILHPEVLRMERERFENSMEKLKETNEEIKEDEELKEIVRENEEVIERMGKYVEVINELLGEGGSIFL